MQEIDYSCVGAAARGAVYGVTTEGVIAQFRQQGIRNFTKTGHRTRDFDDCDIDTLYHPIPLPPFAVDSVLISDCGRGAILKGSSDGEVRFGVARLDRRRQRGGQNVDACDVPFLTPARREGEAPVVAVKWFRGDHDAFGVLRSDASLSVYDAKAAEYPERVYQLRRYLVQSFGIPEKPFAEPVDFEFLPALAWGSLTALVLYSDGCLYGLCPVLPTGDFENAILKAAARRHVDQPVLKALVTEAVSQGSPYVVQHVPVLQGPFNAGLLSQWEATFGEGHYDKAVTLSCASHLKGCSTLIIGTAAGVLYSHVWIDNIDPQLVPGQEAHVTTNGTRICPSKGATRKLKLVEVVKLQERTKKRPLKLCQDPYCPEMAHCQFGSQLFRIRFEWVSAALLGKRPSGQSEIWKFGYEVQFLGSFQDLDASVAVFRRSYRTVASIYRPDILSESQVECLPINTGGQSSAQHIGDLLAQLEGSSFETVKTALQRYEYLTLDSTAFDASFEDIQDRDSDLNDQLTELEHRLEALEVDTPSSLQSLRTFLAAPWPSETIQADLRSLSARFDEIL